MSKKKKKGAKTNGPLNIGKVVLHDEELFAPYSVLSLSKEEYEDYLRWLLEQEQRERSSSTETEIYISPSRFGGIGAEGTSFWDCPRELYYYLRHDTANLRRTYTKETQRIFDMGTDIHNRAQYALVRQYGDSLQVEVPLRLSIADGLSVRGYADGVLETPTGRVGLEIKSVGKALKERKTNGLLNDRYLSQAAFYVAALDLEEMRFLFISKTDGYTVEYSLGKNELLPVWDRVVSVLLQRWNEPEPPVHPSIKKQKIKCPGCPFLHLCGVQEYAHYCSLNSTSRSQAEEAAAWAQRLAVMLKEREDVYQAERTAVSAVDKPPVRLRQQTGPFVKDRKSVQRDCGGGGCRGDEGGDMGGSDDRGGAAGECVSDETGDDASDGCRQQAKSPVGRNSGRVAGRRQFGDRSDSHKEERSERRRESHCVGSGLLGRVPTYLRDAVASVSGEYLRKPLTTVLFSVSPERLAKIVHYGSLLFGPAAFWVFSQPFLDFERMRQLARDFGGGELVDRWLRSAEREAELLVRPYTAWQALIDAAVFFTGDELEALAGVSVRLFCSLAGIPFDEERSCSRCGSRDSVSCYVVSPYGTEEKRELLLCDECSPKVGVGPILVPRELLQD